MKNKVILISIDGMRPDGFLACGHSFTRDMMTRGAYTLSASSMRPSVTLPCHMSIFHSVPPRGTAPQPTFICRPFTPSKDSSNRFMTPAAAAPCSTAGSPSAILHAPVRLSAPNTSGLMPGNPPIRN
ncbi:MAG: alkaline phosphatase family protein [Clostridia bacterium]|nr:alkaline phosphatase family protein [Clostridia bacterium]